MNRLRQHASYANVVATLALFIAIGSGGAYAATQLTKNSVRGKHIQKNAVGSRAIKNASVAIRDLRTKVGVVEHAKVGSEGQLDDNATAMSAEWDGSNRYTLTFRRGRGPCTYAATPGIGGPIDNDPGTGISTRIDGTGKRVTVSTFDGAGNPVASAFHLIIVC